MPLSLRRSAILVALAASQLNGAAAFAPKQSQLANVVSKTGSSSSTARDMKTVQPPSSIINESDKLSYGEESRKYRRTVYTHEEWVKHRSPNRFTRNLSSFGRSGIYKNLAKEVLATTGVAAAIVAWNLAFGDYLDFAGVSHPGPLHEVLPILALPLAPFTLASPSLGLLLGKLADANVSCYTICPRITFAN